MLGAPSPTTFYPPQGCIFPWIEAKHINRLNANLSKCKQPEAFPEAAAGTMKVGQLAYAAFSHGTKGTLTALFLGCCIHKDDTHVRIHLCDDSVLSSAKPVATPAKQAYCDLEHDDKVYLLNPLSLPSSSSSSPSPSTSSTEAATATTAAELEKAIAPMRKTIQDIQSQLQLQKPLLNNLITTTATIQTETQIARTTAQHISGQILQSCAQPHQHPPQHPQHTPPQHHPQHHFSPYLQALQSMPTAVPLNMQQQQPNQNTNKQLIIMNIPYNKDEQLQEAILKISQLKQMLLTKEDFTCFRALSRIEKTNHPTPPHIIIQFGSNIKKNQFRQRTEQPITIGKIFTDHPFNNSPIYINENLPKQARSIYYHTRQYKNKHRYKHAWTRDGNIFIRQTDTSPTHQIKTVDDLNNLPANPSISSAALPAAPLACPPPSSPSSSSSSSPSSSSSSPTSLAPPPAAATAAATPVIAAAVASTADAHASAAVAAAAAAAAASAVAAVASAGCTP
jgi:hypothetical protein